MDEDHKKKHRGQSSAGVRRRGSKGGRATHKQEEHQEDTSTPKERNDSESIWGYSDDDMDL